MSASEFFSDLLHFNFSNAAKRLVDWYGVWPPQLKAFVAKLTDDEGIILWNAATTGLSDLASGKSFQQTVDDVWEIIKDQVPTKAKSDLADALGIQSRAAPTAS